MTAYSLIVLLRQCRPTEIGPRILPTRGSTYAPTPVAWYICTNVRGRRIRRRGDRRRVRRRHGGTRVGPGPALDAAAGGPRPPRRAHVDRPVGRPRHRVRRRLGALAPA